MDREILSEMEKKLQDLHRELGSNMDTLGKEIRQGLPQDREEALPVKQEADVLEEEDRLEGVQINQIEEALARIGEGAFGKCLDCGEDIPIERLTAIPYAKYCIKCQEEREK